MVYLRGNEAVSNGVLQLSEDKIAEFLTVTERAERKISTVTCDLKINAASPWFYAA